MTLIADKPPLKAKDIKNILPYVDEESIVSWKQTVGTDSYRTRPIHRVEFSNGILWLVTEYEDKRSYDDDK